MKRGRFIALEGGEGTGKSTQVKALAAELSRKGLDVVTTREPGGTAGAEAVRDLLLSGEADRWTPQGEALLFAAARADHVARLIRPALAAGTWVVCDRFIDSSRAYQGIAGGLGDDLVRDLHEAGSEDLAPDLTIVIAADEATIAARLADRDAGVSDAIGGRDSDYHARVNAAFLGFADAEPHRFVVIDGVGELDAVSDRVWKAVSPLLDDRA